ncbi:Crp/Fnr family transcriptional regulator [Salmonella enterica]|nr:Crp/Fnr family transcriptional regulator [Salmonella enterica]EBB7877595.1 Crp/Fnr family transcriptional regulator [Salmonella enterica]ECE3294300.1 Crp/Fnr family transcriptional regulator [Salmonella enterica]EED3333764.1 Crp/Fnr family transcriptional regulator [Salmonella enterica subsp. enterica]ELJ7524116.1 Crp/Fnr family transcriptional regulator [Salmonella enterica]
MTEYLEGRKITPELPEKYKMRIPVLKKELCKEHHLLDYLRLFNIDTIIPAGLLTAAKLINLHKNQFLIMQNSRPSGIYLLVDGMLQIGQYDKNGSNIIFTVQNALSVVGDMELFCDECRHSTFSTVQAMQASRVILLPEQSLHLFGLKDASFLQFLCQHLAKKVYENSQNKVSISLTAQDKLHRYLYIQSLIYGNSFQLMKREPLASMLGISVRQLTRALDNLNRTGMISHKNKSVVIHHAPDNL